MRFIIAYCGLLMLAGMAHAAEPTEGPAVDTSTMKPIAASESPLPAVDSDATRSAPVVRQVSAPSDRLDLDTTLITGNRELPKVLYIVPWKKAELGDLPGQPFNTLLDEVLTPVDRDVFRREVTYYEALSSDGADGVGTKPRSTGGTEK